MNKFLKKMVWLVLMLMFCLSPAFAVNSWDYIAATPTSDFIDNGDGTVTHKKTGLTWMRCSMGQTWDNATSNCTGTPSQYKWAEAKALKSDFAGKKDWRLPNIDELLSISDKGKEKTAINDSIFPNTLISSDVWSSSSYVRYSGTAWTVNFSNGYGSGTGKSYSSVVRLVRGGQWFFGFLEEKNKEEALEAKEERLVKAKEEKCMRTPKCRAKKEREESAQNERNNTQHESSQNSRQLCEAQKQTCFATCEGFNTHRVADNDSYSSCHYKCTEINCN